ncbi:hypothetical protein BHF71_06335 [Vulcanibacillus modesticaldus]|uniref:N-acetyltransferase domain-containing protein n=1 Tax=Vulcanibacillus modesticaldus TaxID=337097 RepID=A0A1D2YWD6_9BACI|nr:GNAT family N-acetyltransferase [Vulcanibacillus modesticaldus]OEG00061.1 hypothetical protein BHF71_06335 [Vulcanibacillus modesticaldus]
MKKIKINPRTPENLRKYIIRFVSKYGEGHITKQAINWLRKTPFSSLNKDNGDLIHIYLSESNRIIGVIAIANYGLKQAIIVVHPKARKKGIAYKLTTGVLEDIDRLYVKVANDNIPSIKHCFNVGMRAFDLIKGPTGKPTLILGFGNWNKEEWKKREASDISNI